jgi:thiosulfate/3-mercaptopyruvate sulfurtransferase
MSTLTKLHPTTAAAARLFRPRAMRNFSTFTVTPAELLAELKNPNRTSRIVPVSAEWYLPNDTRTGYSEYLKQRIPGARFFDLDAIKDPVSPYPHMLPDGATFAKAMGELGIKREDTVVVYDSPHIGVFSGPRAAWTFRVFGHEKVHLLNNFKVWKEMGLPMESGEVERWDKTQYPVAQLEEGLVVGFGEMMKLAEGARDGVEIIDARPKGRFEGKDPEPRPGRL